MTQDELMEHVKRIWSALPEDADVALAALGFICNHLVNHMDKAAPGYAVTWMATLQGVFDKNGVRT